MGFCYNDSILERMFKSNRRKEMTKRLILDFLKNNQNELKEKFGVVKIGLFGSYARGEALR